MSEACDASQLVWVLAAGPTRLFAGPIHIFASNSDQAARFLARLCRLLLWISSKYQHRQAPAQAGTSSTTKLRGLSSGAQ